MKLICRGYLLLLFFTVSLLPAKGQNRVFSDVAENNFQTTGQKRLIVPFKYRTIKLDTIGFAALVKLLPSENEISGRNNAPVIEIPMPGGNTSKFHIWETFAMEPALAAAFPGIKTFSGQGIDDPTATICGDWTEFGFHAMILSSVSGSVFIDPYDQKTKTNYISYFKKDYKKLIGFTELPPIKKINLEKIGGTTLASQCIGTQLRSYRLAVACTHEYAQAATGLGNPTTAQVLAKITTSVNRVNSVYEKELSIHFNLIANESAIIFTTAASDPFTGNDDGNTLIDESQTQITQRIGNNNFDIGHTFSTGAGGIAGLGVVCINGDKASGVTGSPNPVGDAYDIDFVCHEIGHQLGADHSFNNENSCGSTAQSENAEPGSGSTIMGYAGVCNDDNLQNNSDPQFHAVSFDAIATYSINQSGNSCAVKTSTGNTPPVVNAGADYVIPKSTPFVLTGSAADVNGDALTYSWEEVDVNGPNGSSTSPSGNAPIFRSFPPVSTGVRYFPKLSDVTAGTTSIGERLPAYARTMNFRLTVRDNRAGGGGVCFDQNQVTVNANAGPFVVTVPNTTGIVWYAGEFKTVTWSVANTNMAPINCTNVNIELSTDGGLTFPITLASNTANDGTEEIQVPNNLSSSARIRVIAVGNIFYDMSDKNFSIQTSPTATFVFDNPAQVSVCGAASGSTTLRTGSLKSFTTAITLSASGVPAGTTVTFGTTPLTPGGSTTVTLNNASGLASGTYTITVTGVAGSVTKTRNIVFLIGSGAPPPSSLTAPANDAIGVSVLPSFDWSTVAGATSYTIEISASNTFSPIRQTVSGIATLPYTLTSALGEDSVYYWRVKSTGGCGTGSASATYRFKTGLNSCRISTDVPKTIAAIGASTVTSTIVIPASLGVTITDLNVVGLKFTHPSINDLTVTLKSPSGTTVGLFDNLCFPSLPDFNLNLDDQATAAIPCPPTGGTVALPQSALSAFNGQSSTGTWTLTVTDNYDQDGGTLDGWGLSINTNSNTCTYTATPIATTYTFTGTGNWTDAANWSNNIVPPSPLPSGSQVIINHAANGQCVLNTSQTISAGATLTVLTGKNLIVPGILVIQ